MRHRAALAVFVALALAPGLGRALEADDVTWGCRDAGYVDPVGGAEAPAFRGLMLLVHTDLGIIPATLQLPEGHVYADTAPRCADLDGDGEDEVVTVIGQPGDGSRIAVYSKRRGPLAESAPTEAGTGLVPLGMADFDGDGRTDIAWIEDSAGAGRLRIGALRDGELVEVVAAEGFVSNRLGADAPMGGVRDCGNGPELVLPSRDWRGLMRVRLAGGALISEPIASATDPRTVAAELACGMAETGAESE